MGKRGGSMEGMVNQLEHEQRYSAMILRCLYMIFRGREGIE